MQRNLLLAAMMAGTFAVTGASAMTKDEYNVAKEKISADYKVAKAKCDTLKDNAKDVCEKEAKGTENVAKAELEQNYKPSNKNAKKVAEQKAEMSYQVAKEKCDDLSGDAKNACTKDAKASHDTAKAEIKRMKG